MMAKLTLAVASAAAILIGAGAQANAQAYGGYLPPPAYAYAGQGGPAYQDEIQTPGDCGGTGFTILGARAGATVLGFDAGVGGHFGFNGFGGGCRRHRSEPVQTYAPPPPQQPPFYGPPPGYPPEQYAPPPPPAAYYSAPQYAPPQYSGPPYSSPCSCQAGGW
jgi:hypothetical protein